MSAYLAVTWQGAWSFLTVLIAFLIVPIVDQFAQGTDHNLTQAEEEIKSVSPFFDLLLYLNLPALFYILWCYFSVISNNTLAVWETIGITMSMGITVGTIGINVAHELGHRKKRYEQLMAKALLTTALYTQFYIEHNRGHHLWVATEEDPSSARLGESLYQFWVRSVLGVYRYAWRLENGRFEKNGQIRFFFFQ